MTSCDLAGNQIADCPLIRDVSLLLLNCLHQHTPNIEGITAAAVDQITGHWFGNGQAILSGQIVNHLQPIHRFHRWEFQMAKTTEQRTGAQHFLGDETNGRAGDVMRALPSLHRPLVQTNRIRRLAIGVVDFQHLLELIQHDENRCLRFALPAVVLHNLAGQVDSRRQFVVQLRGRRV